MSNTDAGLTKPGAILLISCYELGRQPLGIATPAANLQRAGFRPAVQDLSQTSLDIEAVRAAAFVGISVPMHTALVMGVQVAARVRECHPAAHICFFGAYASLNRETLLGAVADSVIGGEIEQTLLHLVQREHRGLSNPLHYVSEAGRLEPPALERLTYQAPDRSGLPNLSRYAKLSTGSSERLAGNVESSRGCKYTCRHCPLTPIYRGRFFAIPRDIVLQDTAALVAAGAEHISFTDPDFFNGPTHAMRLLREMNRRWPHLTYDFTTRISHIIASQTHLQELSALGCLFVVSAAESLNDTVLAALHKGHRGEDVHAALALTRRHGITLRPTFVPFTPWETIDSYLELLKFIQDERLYSQVDPVQLSIRLLVPPGSALLHTPEFDPHCGDFQPDRFTWDWIHPDPRMDRLQGQIAEIVASAAEDSELPQKSFAKICNAARGIAGHKALPAVPYYESGVTAPRLTESWFC